MDGRTGVYREKQLWEQGGAVGSLLSWFQQMMGTLVRRGCPPEAGLGEINEGPHLCVVASIGVFFPGDLLFNILFIYFFWLC